MLTKADVLEYSRKCGAASAYGLLLLAGPDGYDGTYDEYLSMLNDLKEKGGEP